MKILINISTCVNKDIFIDEQLWQILSGKIFFIENIIVVKIVLFNCTIGMVFPFLTWRPGKTAESLRAASCLCAQNIINKFKCYDDIILQQVILNLYYENNILETNVNCVVEFSNIFGSCR